MTDKELHKLGRRELLQLMLAQGREAEKAKQELADAQDKLGQLEESYERLKRRLDDKDTQIHKLRAALQSVQSEPGAPGLVGAVSTAMPVPDDYYAPPQQAEPAPPPPQPPVQPQPQPLPQAAQAPVQQVRPAPQPVRHGDNNINYNPVKPDLPVAPKHIRREQEYYDYLFGPVANQSQPAQPPQRERQRIQPQPPPQQHLQPQQHPQHMQMQQPQAPQPQPQQPVQQPVRAQMPQQRPQQWEQPQQQYAREPQRGYYDMNVPPQYRPPPAAYTYEREQPPPPPPPPPERPPEPVYPVQSQDEFIPAPDRSPESSVQVLNAVEIVNGRPVSQNQVLRPRR